MKVGLTPQFRHAWWTKGRQKLHTFSEERKTAVRGKTSVDTKLSLPQNALLHYHHLSSLLHSSAHSIIDPFIKLWFVWLLNDWSCVRSARLEGAEVEARSALRWLPNGSLPFLSPGFEQVWFWLLKRSYCTLGVCCEAPRCVVTPQNGNSAANGAWLTGDISPA